MKGWPSSLIASKKGVRVKVNFRIWTITLWLMFKPGDAAKGGNKNLFSKGEEVRVVPDHGLALVPYQVLLDMGRSKVVSFIEVDVGGTDVANDGKCISKGGDHLLEITSRRVHDKLKKSLYGSSTDGTFPVVMVESLTDKVNMTELGIEQSSWEQALQKIDTQADQPKSAHNQTMVVTQPLSTTEMEKASSTIQSSTITTTSTATTKTTSTTTQSSWEGPWYGDSSIEYVEGDESLLQSECCTGCICESLETEMEHFIKVSSGRSVVSVYLDGFGLVGTAESRFKFGVTAVVVKGQNGIMLVSLSHQIEPDQVDWLNGKLVLTVSTPNEKLMKFTINVIQCSYCDDMVMLTVKAKKMVKRSILSNLFDLESHTEFLEEIKKIREDQELLSKDNILNSEKLNFQNQKILIHEDHLASTVKNLEQQICQTTSKLSAVYLNDQMMNHASEIGQEVLSIVDTCSNHHIPRALVTSVKLPMLCQAYYKEGCDDEFLKIFKNSISCQVKRIMVSRGKIGIIVDLEVPTGPKVPYQAYRIMSVPVTSGLWSRKLKTQQNDVLIKTSQHMTVVNECKHVEGFDALVCDINSVDDIMAGCFATLVNKKWSSKDDEWCTRKTPATGSACHIVQDRKGLLVSTAIPLKVSNSQRQLNGFRLAGENNTDVGVFYVPAENAASMVECNDIIFSTRTTIEAVKVVIHDKFKIDKFKADVTSTEEVQEDQKEIADLMRIQVLKHNFTTGQWITPQIGYTVITVSGVVVAIITVIGMVLLVLCLRRRCGRNRQAGCCWGPTPNDNMEMRYQQARM